MLLLPKYSPNVTCVIGIDPGTVFMGLAVIFFDVKTLEITHSCSELLRGNNLIVEERHINFHSEKYARIHGMQVRLLSRFNELNPFAVAAEANFMNPKRPQAYGALVESVNSIRFALHQHNSLMALDIIEPSVVKKNISKGSAGKEQINEALQNLSFNIHYHGPLCIKDLVEHETDALAIALWRYQLIVEQANSLRSFLQQT